MKQLGLLLGLIGCLIGCGTRAALTVDEVPEPFNLTLRVQTADGRLSYYEVDDAGVLRFAGGRSALGHAAVDAGTLSDAQRQELWLLIHQYQLFAASGSWFARGEHVTYEMHLRAGRTQNKVQVADDSVDGMSQLNDLLFRYQTQMRYGEVIRPIELEIERRKQSAN